MTYTVWHHGVLLGRTDLAMPSTDPSFRVGLLEPTTEFEGEWPEFGPTVGEFLDAALAVGSAVAGLAPPDPGTDPAERGRQVHERLSSHPGAARLRAATEALTSLGLELRDSDGHQVAARLVMVQEVRPPDWIPMVAITRDVEEARRAGIEIRVPAYLVSVQNVPAAPDPGHRRDHRLT